MNKITVKIDGMMCGMCEAHICDAIRNAFPDAKKVKASKSRREATLLTDNEPSADKLKKVITDTGYTFVSVVSEPYSQMQLTEQQARLLLAFYSSEEMTLKYAEYARSNGMKKYEVSRIGESLSEMGLINRDDPRRLILTDEGRDIAKDIITRIEIAKAHLSYEGVNNTDIDGIALTWAIHCPYSLYDAIERIDQHYKVKSYFNKSESLNGAQLARKIEEGFFVLPCMLHKMTTDPMTPHTNISMANDAFKRSCEVRIHKGRGHVVLFPVMMSMNRTIENPRIHIAKPTVGKPFNFMYWNGNKYVPVQIENDTLKIPIDDFQFVCLGEDILSSLIGTTKAVPARRTETRIIPASSRKSLMARSIPSKAIREINAPRERMPLGIMKSSGLVFLHIKKERRLLSTAWE